MTNCSCLQSQLQGGEDIARCPSCSLIIRVIYDPVSQQSHDVVLTSKDDFVDDGKGDENEDIAKTAEVAA